MVDSVDTSKTQSSLVGREATSGACRLNLGLFGAAFDTGNRGVSALGKSFCYGLASLDAEFSVTVFNWGGGESRDRIDNVGETVSISHVPCYPTRRIYRSCSHQQLQLVAALGLSRFHPLLRRIAGLDAVLDVSGGDSFSDIYGRRRFNSVVVPKRLALRLGRPLILLPQTYGPFMDPGLRQIASECIGSAKAAWARDRRSFEVLKELLGARFDSRRHRCTVDMAFGLPVDQPLDSEELDILCEFLDGGGIVVGINVSALVYNDPSGGASSFGFRGKYQDIIHSLLRALLRQEDVRVLLVSHVHFPRDPAIGDHFVVDAILATLSNADRARVHAVASYLSASELKWVIGKCEWFCGTRMHACIAGLSQGVPTSAIAYSDKALGVFETAGVGECVIDPRVEDAQTVVARLMENYNNRQRVGDTLRSWLPTVTEELAGFYRDLFEQLTWD